MTLLCESRRFRRALIFSALLLPVLYVASFGPACWVCSRVPQSSVSWEITDLLYSPILRAWWHNDQGAIGNVIAWYANLCADGGLTTAKILDGTFCLRSGTVLCLENLTEPNSKLRFSTSR